MKTITLTIVLLLIMNTAFCQSYIPFPSDSGATWRMRDADDEFGNTEAYDDLYFLNGIDTSIHGNIYHEVIIRSHFTPFGMHNTVPLDVVADAKDSIYGFIREQSKKVYIRFNNTTEYLLYDFNLKAGDKVDFYLMKDSIIRVDSINIGGVPHKEYRLSKTDNYAYYEGMGGAHGLINTMHYSMMYGSGPYRALLCFSYKGVTYPGGYCATIYPYGTSLAINNVANENNTTIYPNPFNDKLFIKTTQNNMHLTIYNALGIPVINQLMVHTGSLDNASKLSPGVYLAIISDGKGMVVSKQQLLKL